MKWRPMNTAPRGGDKIILYAGGGEWPFIGYWACPYRFVKKDKGGAWIGHENGLHEDRDLVGWMPCPSELNGWIGGKSR